jgi:hypothetical protein
VVLHSVLISVCNNVRVFLDTGSSLPRIYILVSVCVPVKKLTKGEHHLCQGWNDGFQWCFPWVLGKEEQISMFVLLTAGHLVEIQTVLQLYTWCRMKDVKSWGCSSV